MTSTTVTPTSAASSPALDKLIRLVSEISDLQSKLLLLIGNSGKTRLLRTLADRIQTAPVNVGAKLAPRLVTLPSSDRDFSTNELLREITSSVCSEAPLLLDNLEVLFEPSLKINSLDIIKRLAHLRPVVAVWPGDMRDDHLVYANMGHPEHRDYPRDGVIVFETAQGT
jgi:hypothetical protein